MTFHDILGVITIFLMKWFFLIFFHFMLYLILCCIYHFNFNLIFMCSYFYLYLYISFYCVFIVGGAARLSAARRRGGAAARRGDKLPTPASTPHQPHVRTRRNDISQPFRGHTPVTPSTSAYGILAAGV